MKKKCFRFSIYTKYNSIIINSLQCESWMKDNNKKVDDGDVDYN